MDGILIHFIGFIGSSLSFILWIPQARLTWKNRKNPEKLSAVSVGTQWVVVANAITWGIYAVLTGAWWAGAPGVINLPLAVGTIFLISKARKISVN